jgi:hypothetical protein
MMLYIANRNSLVPREPTIQSRVTEAGTTVICFVERVGNKSDMLKPLQEYIGKVRELRVDYSNPASVVKERVQEFLQEGKRICDRNKKNIAAEDCYSVATREENKNMLFLIPDVGLRGKAEEQGYKAPKRGDQAVEGLSDHEIPQKIIQKREMEQTQDHEVPEGEYQVTEGLENYGIPRQETPEEDDNDLLDQEKENLDNACILDSDTVVIRLKKRVDDMYNNSKPAKDWEWTELKLLEVPIGDPGGIVERSLKALFEESLLEPYNSQFRQLYFEDGYNAAIADGDHTLYFIEPRWIPSNFVLTNLFPSTKFP